MSKRNTHVFFKGLLAYNYHLQIRQYRKVTLENRDIMVKDSKMQRWVSTGSISDVSYLSASMLLGDKYFLVYFVQSKIDSSHFSNVWEYK